MLSVTSYMFKKIKKPKKVRDYVSNTEDDDNSDATNSGSEESEEKPQIPKLAAKSKTDTLKKKEKHIPKRQDSPAARRSSDSEDGPLQRKEQGRQSSREQKKKKDRTDKHADERSETRNRKDKRRTSDDSQSESDAEEQEDKKDYNKRQSKRKSKRKSKHKDRRRHDDDDVRRRRKQSTADELSDTTGTSPSETPSNKDKLRKSKRKEKKESREKEKTKDADVHDRKSAASEFEGIDPEKLKQNINPKTATIPKKSEFKRKEEEVIKEFQMKLNSHQKGSGGAMAGNPQNPFINRNGPNYYSARQPSIASSNSGSYRLDSMKNFTGNKPPNYILPKAYVAGGNVHNSMEHRNQHPNYNQYMVPTGFSNHPNKYQKVTLPAQNTLAQQQFSRNDRTYKSNPHLNKSPNYGLQGSPMLYKKAIPEQNPTPSMQYFNRNNRNYQSNPDLLNDPPSQRPFPSNIQSSQSNNRQTNQGNSRMRPPLIGKSDQFRSQEGLENQEYNSLPSYNRPISNNTATNRPMGPNPGTNYISSHQQASANISNTNPFSASYNVPHNTGPRSSFQQHEGQQSVRNREIVPQIDQSSAPPPYQRLPNAQETRQQTKPQPITRMQNAKPTVGSKPDIPKELPIQYKYFKEQEAQLRSQQQNTIQKESNNRGSSGQTSVMTQGQDLDHVNSLNFFYPSINRVEAENMLSDFSSQDGTYLVRRSNSPNAGLVLSVMADLSVKHFVINRNERGQYHLSMAYEDAFDTVPQLMEHLRIHGIDDKYVVTVPLTHEQHQKQQQQNSHRQNSILESITGNWYIDPSHLHIQYEKELGSGRFGVVYKGTLEGGTAVAVKTVKAIADQENFVRETEMLKHLRHPRLTRLYGVTTLPGNATGIIMEFLINGNLLEYLWDVRKWVFALKDNKKAAFGEEVAEGMAYLESQRVVHRDLAARNILLSQDMTVKISDFGLSRFMKEDEEIIPENVHRPLRWMAPESITDKKFSSKSDVWAYGILLLEIYTLGDCPYPEFNDGELVEQITKKNYRSPRPKHCPESIFNDIMTRCWQTRPVDRPTFADILDVWKSLNRH